MRDKLIQKLKSFNALPYAIMFIMALILGQIAPYNSDEIQNFGLRTGYWAAILIVSYMAWTIIEKFFAPRLNWHYFFVGSLCNFLMTLPLFGFILLLNLIFFNLHNTWLGLFYFWLQLAITCQSIYILIYVIISQVVKTGVDNQKNCPPETTPHFLKNIGGKLLYIKSEDHYLRIQTTAHSKLILYKISDAIKQLDESDIEGKLVHRSHWVAKSAIESHVKNGRKNLLKLTNGDQLPISATYLKTLRSEGYI
ncbi:MAG: hypothetical protein COB24_10545 [Hyphomicrobiales bacterium]|nr:MAG: hypothetical protein COB24_10545 [Hyphomicrobiales bacterium]